MRSVRSMRSMHAERGSRRRGSEGGQEGRRREGAREEGRAGRRGAREERSGADGADGADGAGGTDGADGAVGADGADGADGVVRTWQKSAGGKAFISNYAVADASAVKGAVVMKLLGLTAPQDIGLNSPDSSADRLRKCKLSFNMLTIIQVVAKDRAMKKSKKKSMTHDKTNEDPRKHAYKLFKGTKDLPPAVLRLLAVA